MNNHDKPKPLFFSTVVFPIKEQHEFVQYHHYDLIMFQKHFVTLQKANSNATCHKTKIKGIIIRKKQTQVSLAANDYITRKPKRINCNAFRIRASYKINI